MVDHGPGLLEPFLCQIWTLLKGVSRRARGVVRGSRTLVDGLMEAVLSKNKKIYSMSETTKNQHGIATTDAIVCTVMISAMSGASPPSCCAKV